jgi:hypothetical protein
VVFLSVSTGTRSWATVRIHSHALARRYEITNDHDPKSGQTSRLVSITAMAAYQTKSFEELRWEDYQRRAAGGGGGAFVQIDSASMAPAIFDSEAVAHSAQLSALKLKLEASEKLVADLRPTAAKLTAALAAARRERANALACSAKVSNLEAALTSARQDLAQVRTELDSSSAAHSAQVSAMMLEQEASVKQVADLKQTLTKLNADLKAAKEDASREAARASQVSILDAALTAARAEAADARAALVAATTTHSAQHLAVTRKLECSEKRVADFKEEVAKLAVDVKAARDDAAAEKARADKAVSHSGTIRVFYEGSEDARRSELESMTSSGLRQLLSTLAQLTAMATQVSLARDEAERASQITAAVDAERTKIVEEMKAQDAAERACTVCMDRPKSTVLIPCGHRCVCSECAAVLTARSKPVEKQICPICRKKIERTLATFDS